MKRFVIIVGCSLWYLTVSAGAWTLPHDTLVMKSSLFVQQTMYRFASKRVFCGDKQCKDGEYTPYLFSGALQLIAGFADFRYGYTDRLEFQKQLPYYHISFTDDI
ncbi:MAG: hypothetical protein JKX73_02040, partial [Flavobacteriales bacterium]|nr:hypothetical protein [Flavobacteriales bacterium]